MSNNNTFLFVTADGDPSLQYFRRYLYYYYTIVYNVGKMFFSTLKLK